MQLHIFLQASPASEGVSFFLPMILVLFVFYFFMIRPQINKQKEEGQFQSNIKKGDRIGTNGGSHGKISGIKEEQVILEISNTTKITIDRDAISREKTALVSKKKIKR